MIVNVWLIAKKGEDRVYTRTTQPDETQVKAYKEAGFKVYRAAILMPTTFDDDDLDGTVIGSAFPVE